MMEATSRSTLPTVILQVKQSMNYAVVSSGNEH